VLGLAKEFEVKEGVWRESAGPVENVRLEAENAFLEYRVTRWWVMPPWLRLFCLAACSLGRI
jgi:hypothetical protein